MKWPEGQGGGAEVRNDITNPRGDRAVKRAELTLLSKNEIQAFQFHQEHRVTVR